ncbi:MAG: hypothetical protein ACE5HO_19430 [bacterium]
MSEYQYYEFEAIDRRLSESDKIELQQISSRVRLTSSKAMFVYNYGDFPDEAERVLAKYFDAMLYVTNWGTKRLMFRFPLSLIDPAELMPYCVQDIISITVINESAILDIWFEEEDSEWVDGEDWLSSLIGLRAEVLRGDFRFLYVAWLHATQLSEGSERDDKPIEPPLHDNFQNLTPSLTSFIEFLEIAPDQLAGATVNSQSKRPTSPLDFEKLIPMLSDSERNDFLVRLARGEPNLDIKLLKALRNLKLVA